MTTEETVTLNLNRNDVITIPETEYQKLKADSLALAQLNPQVARLVRDSEFLNCLQAAGVDNWDGYAEAVEMMNAPS